MTETRPTICRYCPAHCGVLATIENGRITKVSGDPDNPLYRGYSCVKGRALPEQHYDPARLLSSMARSEDGGHRPIASGQAMDEIAAKVGALVERHGPRCVAMYVGTNTLPYPAAPGFAHAWLRGVRTPMFFTSNTIDQPGKQIAAALHGAWHGGDQSFEDADTWLMVGLNPVIAKSSGAPCHNPAQRLKEAVSRGMKLIVVDPRRSETARRAHIHLQPRPGEDPTILAGLLHVIIEEGLYDRAFIEENVEGFDAVAEQVKAFTPDYVAARAGVPAEQVLEAARVFAGGKRGGVYCGTGPNFATRGTLSEYLGRVLASLCGRWARPGDKVLRPNVMLPAFTAKAQPYPPYPGWGFGEQLRIRNLADTAAGLPTAALADEILGDGEGRVRALVCMGSSPMMAWPDQSKAFAALQKLELLVTIDPVMSPTARLADYVIAPKLTLETPGMTQSIEMLKYFGPGLGLARPYAQYSPKLVDPPEGSDLLEEWEFFYGLSQRMGIEVQQIMFYGWGQHIESPPQIFPIDMENKPTTDQIFELMTQGARVPFEEVKRHPHGHIFEDIDDVVQPRDPECEIKLDAGEPHMMAELSDVRAENFEASHGDPRYRFRLIPRRADAFVNSSGRTIKKLLGNRPYNPAFMHPEDLQDLGVGGGDVVRISSEHGTILGVVEEDADLRRGVVSMTHGFGGNPTDEADVREIGSNTGMLMSVEAEYDPASGMPRMGAIPVAVEPDSPS